MKVSIESVDSVQRKIAFEIPAERVSQEVEKAYKAVQKRARLKGFRPGKIPRNVLQQYFGEQVSDDVSSLLVQESYQRAVDENELRVVTQPNITTEKLILGQPFRYSATVEIRPAITITDYEGIEVEKQLETVAEEEVESTLLRLTESFSQLHPVLDRQEVESGDVLTLDYVALRDGRPVPGLEAKGRLIEMGRETLLQGFQDNLLGAQRGRALQFSVPLPKSEEKAQQTEGAEQETGLLKTAETIEESLLFRVTIHDIAHKEIPVLDDDFAKDHGECETLEELRNKIRENLQSAADQRVENQMNEALLVGIYEKNPFEVPPSLVREQLRQLFVESGIQRQEEDVSVGEGRLTEELRDQFTARARQSVQSAFLLDALVDHLSVSVVDEDVRRKIEELSASGAEQQRQVEAFYAKDENRQSLERQLMREKAIQAVVDKAQIKTVDKEVAGAQEKD